MAGGGLLAGLQGYEQAAEGPSKRFGAAISGAVEAGMQAEDMGSRMREREAEGQRSQQRVDMAQALQPGQLRGQDLSNDTRAMVLKEAGDKHTRETAQRDYFGSVVRPKIERGEYTDPKEARLDILKGIMIGGDQPQIRAAFADYQRSLTEDETAKQFDGMLFHVWGAQAKAATATTTEERAAILLNGIGEGRRLYPLATGSPEIRQLITDSFKLSRQMSEPLKQAFTRYVELSAANPGLTPSQVWSRAGEKMDPGFLPEWNGMKPNDVKEDEKARLEVTKAKAEETVKQPGRIELKRVEGEETRKTEVVREAGREAREKAKREDEQKADRESLKNLQSELNNYNNNLARVDAFGQQVLKGDERMQAISRRDRITAEVDRLRAKGTPGAEAAPARPVGLSAARLGEARTMMQTAEKAKDSKLTSMYAVDRYLSDPGVQAYLSAEESAALRAEYQKKFGGK